MILYINVVTTAFWPAISTICQRCQCRHWHDVVLTSDVDVVPTSTQHVNGQSLMFIYDVYPTVEYHCVSREIWPTLFCLPHYIDEEQCVFYSAIKGHGFQESYFKIQPFLSFAVHLYLSFEG